ncbi:hypothetical protein EBR57_09250 [bacterium]|nr:hypothetical protein [bacterium]
MIQRGITALILLGIASVVIKLGGLAMLAWVWLIAIVAAYEMFAMLRKQGLRPYQWTGYAMISIAILSAYYDPHFILWGHPLVRVGTLAVVAAACTELGYRRIWIPKSNLLATARVIGFISLTFTYIFLLREGSNGLINFLFCILVVWATDSFALVGGRIIGRTPLSQISPKKTIEGSLIGLIGALAVAWIYMLILGHYWHFNLNPIFYSVLAIGVGIVSQLGDLHESLFKRHFGVKDSSTLLPGHGGIYDRADSTLMVAPIAFYIFN